ncbi:hypothetical protein AX15_002826 [Amanita polypyramis BW_CC]|nr:hypothetical protein AX15_002826 [Amanita polypyramis BW_CC]
MALVLRQSPHSIGQLTSRLILAGKLSEPRKTTSSSAKNLDSNTEMAPTSAVESNSATTETTKAGSENTPQEDEEEGTPSNSSGGAFNPETGEINWDCPCLGGMAHGPCGPQFREAFSCFVFSEVEPKGMDCVEKFKAMQDCFRAHPDIYADEIMDDEEEEGAPATGEESSAATGIANDEKDSALTASSPRTEPVPRDLPSDTTTPTTSS